MTPTLDDFMTETEPATPTVHRLGAKWTVDPKQRTETDWTPYLEQKLLVSLELEYNFKEGVETITKDEFGKEQRHNTFDSAAREEVGVSEGDYASCPVCGDSGCWKCDPPKTIRIVKADCTIKGREFIVIGSPIPSEEFVKRLPLANIRKYFEPCYMDSMHSHVLIPSHNEKIPVSIGQNMWQLFRVYYPAWAYIFGNRKGSIIRGNWATWHDYDEDASDFDYWWNSGNENTVKESTPRTIARRYKHGLTFASCYVDEDKKVFNHFDVEIRQTDASQDPEQIVAARSLSKALVLKSAQLATKGVINIPEDRWTEIEPIIRDINRSNSSGLFTDLDLKLEQRQGAKMRAMAKEFYKDIRDLLTPYERQCVKRCVLNPIRKRHPNHAGYYGED